MRYIGLLNIVKFNISNRMSNRMFALLAIGAIMLSIGVLFGFSAVIMFAMNQLFGVPDVSFLNAICVFLIILILYLCFAREK